MPAVVPGGCFATRGGFATRSGFTTSVVAVATSFVGCFAFATSLVSCCLAFETSLFFLKFLKVLVLFANSRGVFKFELGNLFLCSFVTFSLSEFEFGFVTTSC